VTMTPNTTSDWVHGSSYKFRPHGQSPPIGA
jgi:hypothetical protein